MAKNKRLILIALYIGITIYILPMFPHGGSANELTRWATAASIVEKGSLDIAWTTPLIGPNVDTARVGDRVYSNKAPLPAFLSVPFYAVTRVFTGSPDASNIRISWFLMRFAVSTVPLLLLVFWLYRRGVDEFGLAALLFATPLFVYSLLLFSHVLAGVLIYAAFRLLFDKGELTLKRVAVAGAACGVAVTSEFPAVFAVAVLCVGLLLRDRKAVVDHAVWMISGGLPFLLLLLIYNQVLFGSPFSFSYAHESFPEWATVAGQGVFGIGVPTLSNIYLLLVSPSRGLFFFTPLFFCSVIAMFRSPERSSLRSWVRAAAIVLPTIILCGHGAAHGGWSFGVRYLVFVMPLLLDPFFECRNENAGIFRGLTFGVSMIFASIGVLTFPFAPPEYAFPHNELFIPMIFGEGFVTPTLLSFAGVANAAISALPVVLVLLTAAAIVMLSSNLKAKMLTGMALAGVVAGLCFFVPGKANEAQARIRRESIVERYFRPDDRLVTERADAARRGDLVSLKLTNDLIWTVANARAYAPNDRPYLSSQMLPPSPSVLMNRAAAEQSAGKPDDAISTLLHGRDIYPALSCEFGSGLGIVYYAIGQKTQAEIELTASAQTVTPGSSAECQRSQFLLGILYRDAGRKKESDERLRQFLLDTDGTNDRDLIELRKQAAQR